MYYNQRHRREQMSNATKFIANGRDHRPRHPPTEPVIKEDQGHNTTIYYIRLRRIALNATWTKETITQEMARYCFILGLAIVRIRPLVGNCATI
jgi:hypothetical protein